MICEEQFSELYNILDELEKLQEQTLKVLKIEDMMLNKMQFAIQKNKKNKKNKKNEKNNEDPQSISQFKRNELQCYFCKESLQDFERFNSHYLAAHNTKILHYGPTKFSCRFCFKDYKGIENLLLHERNTKHQKKVILYQAAQM